MRKNTLLCALVAVGCLAFGSLHAAPQEEKGPSLDYLKTWAGELVVRASKDGKGVETFWNDPNVLRIMKKNIPKELYERITKGWPGNAVAYVTDPIKKEGNLLLVSVCRPHFCRDEAAFLFFDLKKASVQLCWTSRNEKTNQQTDLWVDKNVRILDGYSCRSDEPLAVYRRFSDPSY